MWVAAWINGQLELIFDDETPELDAARRRNGRSAIAWPQASREQLREAIRDGLLTPELEQSLFEDLKELSS